VFNNDKGLNDSNHAQFKVYILAASNCFLQGKVEATMLDIAWTILELGDHAIPTSMQEKSLMPWHTINPTARGGTSSEREEIIGDRDSGIGCIS